MTLEMTADGMFAPGQRAPRGTYLCLESGVVHRLTKPTDLPLSGPFRLVAPTAAIGPCTGPTLAHRWPEEEGRANTVEETEPSWLRMLLCVRIARQGLGW